MVWTSELVDSPPPDRLTEVYADRPTPSSSALPSTALDARPASPTSSS
ncbi:hypothetical protein [Embleya scabrispora]|nr:hypothetical protein [Embleya scabrispora]